jgi:hypothetical protein
MGEAAGRTAVVYDARADEFDEPLRVFVTGYSATGLRNRRRSQEYRRYSWLEDCLAARRQRGAPGVVLLAVVVGKLT